MNKHTIENIIIFSVIYCRSHNDNGGKTYKSYIKEKSERYLGVDITQFKDINVHDFTIKFDKMKELEIAPPDIILGNLENKIDISELDNSNNIHTNIVNSNGDYHDVIYGLDMSNTYNTFDIINSFNVEYYTNIIRKYKINSILDE